MCSLQLIRTGDLLKPSTSRKICRSWAATWLLCLFVFSSIQGPDFSHSVPDHGADSEDIKDLAISIDSCAFWKKTTHLLPLKAAEFFNQDFLTNIHILLNKSKTEPLKIDISTATTAENTENSLVCEERDTRDFDFDAELDDLLSRLDLEDFLNSNSQEYFHFWKLLECELADEQSDLSDFLSHLAFQSENAQIVDQNDYDFECGVLNINNLRAKGLSESVLKLVSEGIPVDFKAGFSTDRIRPKPNSRHVSQNRDIVAKVIASLVRSGHVSPVAEKPAVLCTLNVIAKSNGSPRLIHNLHALNQGVSQPNLFALARSWSRSTFLFVR